jgi:hypothetical protein
MCLVSCLSFLIFPVSTVFAVFLAFLLILCLSPVIDSLALCFGSLPCFCMLYLVRCHFRSCYLLAGSLVVAGFIQPRFTVSRLGRKLRLDTPLLVYVLCSCLVNILFFCTLCISALPLTLSADTLRIFYRPLLGALRKYLNLLLWFQTKSRLNPAISDSIRARFCLSDYSRLDLGCNRFLVR